MDTPDITVYITLNIMNRLIVPPRTHTPRSRNRLLFTLPRRNILFSLSHVTSGKGRDPAASHVREYSWSASKSDGFFNSLTESGLTETHN